MQPGKLYAFRYRGGTEPNSMRTVYVTTDNGTSFRGYCFEREEYRNYYKASTYDVKDFPCKRVNLLAFPDVDVDALIDALEEKEQTVYHDEDRKELIVFRSTDMPGPLLQTTSNGVFKLVGNGRVVYLDSARSRMSIGNGWFTPTAQSMIDAIKSVE